MAEQVRVWQITSDDKLVETKQAKLNLESRVERWIEQDISLLAPDLLIIGRQVATDFGGFIDLLCMDSEGELVVVELKRNKTPREITAQALDYASWVKDLSAERIREIAGKYLPGGESLEDAFSRRFDMELPEVINGGHSMIVVGSQIDASTQRIMEYLSGTYGVGINAATFQYLQTEGGGELLVRSFAVAPEQVKQNARSQGGAKRTVPSPEEMERVATEHGVGDLYRASRQIFAPMFRVGNTKTTSTLQARLQ